MASQTYDTRLTVNIVDMNIRASWLDLLDVNQT
jgi:hypothetical protein